jgi:hypothetical protein
MALRQIAQLCICTTFLIEAFAFLPFPSGTPQRKPIFHIMVSSTQSSSDSKIDNASLDQAKKLITQAISLGAPAYNAGDIAECVRIYQETTQQIAPLVPTSLQPKLNNVEQGTELTDNAKAWALRTVMDSILEYEPPLIPHQVDEKNKLSFEPFSKGQLPDQPLSVMDNVMGGISQGSWNSEENILLGYTSLENNGGFVSFRWRFSNIQNWSFAKGIYILGLQHSKPEEHTFRIILKDATCEQVRLANFKAVFANPLQTKDHPLLIPFSAFDQMERMGKAMVGAPTLTSSAVTEIGIMAIKPMVVGEFELQFTEWGLYL